MTEIIKKGEVPKYRCVCTECKTEFLYERIDAEESCISGMGHIKCPVCGIDNLIFYDKPKEENDD